MLFITLTIKNKQYRAFIKYAIKTCDSFSFVFEKDYMDSFKYVLQEIYYIVNEFVLSKKSILGL